MAQIKCPDCGSKIDEKASMCMYCGGSVTPAENKNNPTPPPTVPNMNQYPNQYNPYQGMSPQRHKKKNRGCLAFFIAIIIIGIIVGTIVNGINSVIEDDYYDEDRFSMLDPDGRETGERGSRSKPYKLGKKAVFNGLSSYSHTYKAEITVTQVIRGEKALKMIKKANAYNSEPKSGREYMLVKIKVKALKSKKDKAVSLGRYDFDFVSQKGQKYNNRSFISGLSPELSDIYAGATTTGYIYQEIDKGDNPSIAFLSRQDYGIWFATK